MPCPIVTCTCGHDRGQHTATEPWGVRDGFCLVFLGRGERMDTCPCRAFVLPDHRAAALEACAPFNPAAPSARVRPRRTA